MATLVKTTLGVTSPVFGYKGFIPAKYTCEGENINPPVIIEDIPPGTKSLTLIVTDPDAPGRTFDHWIVWNIRPVKMIAENTIPGIEGKNSFGKIQYQGPCPPPLETHRYFFKLYALNILLDVQAGTDKENIEKAMKEHIIASGELIGMYCKSK